MNEPLCCKCGTETEWKEYLRCPNCYLRLPVVQQLRERIEQLRITGDGTLQKVHNGAIDDVLALLNSQQEKRDEVED